MLEQMEFNDVIRIAGNAFEYYVANADVPEKDRDIAIMLATILIKDDDVMSRLGGLILGKDDFIDTLIDNI